MATTAAVAGPAATTTLLGRNLTLGRRVCVPVLSPRSLLVRSATAPAFADDHRRPAARQLHRDHHRRGGETLSYGCWGTSWSLRDVTAPYRVIQRGHRRQLSTGKASGDAAASAVVATAASTSDEGASNRFQVVKVAYNEHRLHFSSLTTPELLKTAGIYARDLFTLNVTSRQERLKQSARGGGVRRALAAIVTRDDMILLSFGSIRAVANLEQVLLLDADNVAVKDFARDLAHAFAAKKHSEYTGETPENDEPFELVFLEMVLRDTVDSFHRRLRLLEPIVDNFLDRVADEIYSDTGVHQLVPLKDCLQSCEIQVRTCLDCLTALLNDDDEMLSLLLTEQARALSTGRPVDFHRHEHVELLIGVYARQISNIAMELNFLLGRLQSKQEFVALALAGYRNRMVRMNVHVGIAGLSLAFCTTVAGFFGMNLANGMETSHSAFLTVVALSCLTSGMISVSSMNYLSGRKMRIRAEQRLEEIDTLTNALSDLCALDYVVKVVEAGHDLDKERFEKVYTQARQVKNVTHKEMDMLFDTFDTVKDGFLRPNDFDSDRSHPSIFTSTFSEPAVIKVERIKQDKALSTHDDKNAPLKP